MACTILFPRFLGPVYVDVVLTEDATASMEIPQHPVERGAKISDHAWRLPNTLKLENLNQSMTAWGDLTSLMAEAEPFDVVSGFDLFENMMIQSIEAHRDKEFPDVLYYTASLQEVIIVSTAEGPAVGNAGTGGDERGKGMASRGQVQAREVGSVPGGLPN